MAEETHQNAEALLVAKSSTVSLRSPRERGVLSVEVADFIRSSIFNGTLKARERVPQDAIAAELGVSRVPVREALIALERIGLVVSEPHRGMFVVPFSRDDISDHYQIYGLIQGLATSRAARGITEPVIDRLQELHDRMCNEDDRELHEELNYEFHRLINHTGGSKRIRSTLKQLGSTLPRDLYKLAPAASPKANVRHAEILQALIDGDEAAANAAGIAHAREEGDFIIALLAESGVLDD